MDLPIESILFDDVYYENGINKYLKSVRESIRDTIAEEMRLDSNVFFWEKKLESIKEHIRSVKAYQKNLVQKEL